jgi:hypothetical protein
MRYAGQARNPTLPLAMLAGLRLILSRLGEPVVWASLFCASVGGVAALALRVLAWPALPSCVVAGESPRPRLSTAELAASAGASRRTDG